MHIAVDRRTLSVPVLGGVVVVAGTALFFAVPYRVAPVVVVLAGLILTTLRDRFLIFGTPQETARRFEQPLALLSLPFERNAERLSLTGRGVEVRVRSFGPLMTIRIMMKRPPGKTQRYLSDVLLKSQRAILKII